MQDSKPPAMRFRTKLLAMLPDRFLAWIQRVTDRLAGPYRRQADRAFREACLWRVVRESQRKPDFNDRVFACESDEEAPILTPGRHLTPSHKVLLGQNAAGAPVWLQFSETTIRWPDEELAEATP